MLWTRGLDSTHLGLWGDAWMGESWGIVEKQQQFGGLLNRIKNRGTVFLGFSFSFVDMLGFRLTLY